MARTDVPPPNNHQIRRLQYENLITEMKTFVMSIVDMVIESGGELDLQIRSNYFNVYYKGGSIWTVNNISPSSRGIQITVEKEYFNRPDDVLDSEWLPGPKDPLNEWLATIPQLQEILNGWFQNHNNRERQLQHELAVNYLSNPRSKWIILDVEYAAWLHGQKDRKKDEETRRLSKFDLIGVKRHDLNGSQAIPVYVMELKQGNGAIEGPSSITSHAEDMEQLICHEPDVNAKKALMDSIRRSFSEKQTLGLMPNITANIIDREIQLRPAFILEDIDDTAVLREQKTRAQEILSDCYSEVPWYDYNDMLE
jgi:hypothetical protein